MGAAWLHCQQMFCGQERRRVSPSCSRPDVTAQTTGGPRAREGVCLGRRCRRYVVSTAGLGQSAGCRVSIPWSAAGRGRGSVTSEPSQPLSCCPQGAWRKGGSPSSPPATASRDDGGLALYAAGRQVSRGPRRGCSAAVVTPELGHSPAGSRHHGGGSPRPRPESR